MLLLLQLAALSWPDMAGHCFAATGGHPRKTSGTGSVVLSTVAESEHVELRLGGAERFMGFVIHTSRGELGSANGTLPSGLQFKTCCTGRERSAVTHTSKAYKSDVRVRLRLGADRSSTLRALVLHDFRRWYQFRQDISVSKEGGVHLTAAVPGSDSGTDPCAVTTGTDVDAPGAPHAPPSPPPVAGNARAADYYDEF